MRVFSLTTAEDFKGYISALFLFIVPIIVILLIPYFLYTSAFIGILGFIFDSIRGAPIVLQWLLSLGIPTATVGVFFFWKPQAIFIGEEAIELEYKSHKKERMTTSDISNFTIYRTLTPWTWGDLSREVHYPSLYPVVIERTNGVGLSLFMKGEVWNAMRSAYPTVPIKQIPVFNRWSLTVAIIATLNLLNGIAIAFIAFGNVVR